MSRPLQVGDILVFHDQAFEVTSISENRVEVAGVFDPNRKITLLFDGQNKRKRA